MKLFIYIKSINGRGGIMSFKPSSEEQKWAKIIEFDTKKRLKEDIRCENLGCIPGIIPAACPNDGILLDEVEIDKKGIIIKKCPFCGGIWIDRGNLEKLFHSSKNSQSFIVYLAKILNIKITEI